MLILPPGVVDFFVSDPSITSNSQVFVTFLNDPGDQMGAGTIQWIENHPGSGFTIHLNTTCQDFTPFIYTDVTSETGPGVNYWNRIGNVLSPLNANDNIKISENSRYYLNDDLTVYLQSTGFDLLLKDAYLSNAIPISENGTSGLDSWFFGQANSIVKALNVLATNINYLTPQTPLSLTGQDMNYYNTTFVTGYLSDGLPNNFITLTPGMLFSSIIEDATFNANTPNTERFDQADKGILELWINGVLVDSFDLQAHFNESERAGVQSYPPANSPNGKITITDVRWYNNWPPFQKGTARINITPSDLQPGENSIYLKHTGITPEQTTNTRIIFYDTNVGNRPISGTPTITENTLSSNRYLSGVRYYSIGDTFDVSTSLTGVFDNTYHDSPLVLTLSTCGIPNQTIAWNSPDVSGHSSPPKVGEAFNFSHTAYAISLSNVYSINARITSQGRDPFGFGLAVQSISENRLVNTYGNISTETIEEFVDENRRLSHFNIQGDNTSGVNEWDSPPSSPTGQWNSQLLLANGEAQCYNNGLYYPRLNYTSGYLPSAQTADYSSFSGNQYYVRAMITNGNPSNSGTIRLVGWTLPTFLDPSEGGTPTAKVEIKIPGVTPTGTWWDLGKSFGNSNGCRTSATGELFGYSTGTESTAGVNMIIIRITLFNDSVPLLNRIEHSFIYT